MMTAEQLKNSILHLALSGKLVEQRTEEGTGEELFEQIWAEKKRLVKEGKIKKQKALPEILEEEIPFEIPAEWKWTKLGEIIDFRMGKTPPRAELSYWGSDVPWVSIADMIDGKVIYNTKESISYKALSERFNGQIAPKGTLIMSFKLTVGKVSILGEDAVHNEAIISIIPFISTNNIMRDYLMMMLPFLSTYGKSKKAIMGFTLNSTSLNNIPVPLPPLAEQKRIVAKIEELMPFVEQYAAASTKLNTLNASFPEMMKKSILQEAVQGKLVPQDPSDEPASLLLKKIAEEKKRLIREGKIKKQKPLPEITEDEIPFEIPESWEWVRIGEIFKVGTGMTPLKGNSLFYDGGTIPWITSSLTSERYITQADSFVTQYAVENTTLTVYPAHSLIIAMYGQGKTRGQVSELLINATTNQACAVLEYYLYYSELIEYTYYYFMFNYDVLRKKAEGTSQPNLNLKKIAETIIPIPPLNDQRRIMAKTKEIFYGIDTLSSKL